MLTYSFHSGKRGSFESQRLSICSDVSGRRHSSARTMSQNVQQNLRALRQEQHRYILDHYLSVVLRFFTNLKKLT